MTPIDNARTKMIDRVIKLLAMADSTIHSEEAKIFRAKAVELMAKENIELGDVNKVHSPFLEKDEPLTRKTPIKYDALLNNVVCLFSGVALIVKTRGMANGSYVYVGRHHDIEAAHYMYNILIQQREAAWKVFLAKFKLKFHTTPTDKEKIHWMNGFAYGVDEKLQSLKRSMEAAVTERGLVPVDPAKQALAWYEKSNKVKETRNQGLFNGEGFKAGKEASIHKGLGKPTDKKLIGN